MEGQVGATILTTSANWLILEADPILTQRLESELMLHPVVARALVNRGISNLRDAEIFLSPSLDHLHDPKLMPDYEPAVKAILGAKERGERIFVHGDYDVDGVTSTALFTRFLRRIGCDVVPHVPHRMKEGYGIHPSAIEAAREMNAKLFLTCDCGVGAHEQVAAAKALGMAVVVTDHHEVPTVLPEADAVINLHRTDSSYPFTDLAGVGVAFKLCEGISEELGLPKAQFYRAFLDLAALGTVADVMPLVGENRILTKFGLQALAETKKVGLQALKTVSSVGAPVSTMDIGFKLAPRLNAAGRIDDAAMSLDLLLEDDLSRAAEMADQLDAINSERKATQGAQLEQAIQAIKDEGFDKDFVIVVAREEWHGGIVGLVANKVVEHFKRPAFILSIDSDAAIAKGSARSIPAFNLFAAIENHREILIGGGGHKAAAGISVSLSNLEVFRQRVNDYARTILTEADFVPTLIADAELLGTEADLEAARALTTLEPFGQENPEPLFVIRNVELASIEPTKNPGHLRIQARSSDGSIRRLMGFGFGERLAGTKPGTQADVLVRIEDNRYQGASTLNWILQDLREVQN